jgi:hypothetical protein
MLLKTHEVQVEYISHSEGIHEIIQYESSRESSDAVFDRMEAIFADSTEGECVRILFDLQHSGMPPMRYSFGRSQNFLKQLKSGTRFRAALIHETGTMVALANSFLNLLSKRMTGRFFAPEEREAAIAWLLQKE